MVIILLKGETNMVTSEMAKRWGRPRKFEGKPVAIIALVEPEFKAAVEAQAVKDGVTVSDLIRHAVTMHLDREKEKHE
jgi:hypothetical protein